MEIMEDTNSNSQVSQKKLFFDTILCDAFTKKNLLERRGNDDDAFLMVVSLVFLVKNILVTFFLFTCVLKNYLILSARRRCCDTIAHFILVNRDKRKKRCIIATKIERICS